MTTSLRFAAPRLVATTGTLILLVLLLSGSAAAEPLRLPADGASGLWETEDAQAGAWKKVVDEMASGGAMMRHESADSGAPLVFRFTTDRATALRIVPVWWLNSEKKPAQRFPDWLPQFTYQHLWPVAYPSRAALQPKPLRVKQKPGPDTLAVLGGKLYFTSPLWGSVGVVDGVSEKVTGEIRLGGYIADLVADPQTARLFAADARSDTVVVIDAKTEQILKRIAVDKMPYSLALVGGRVVAACMEGKSLAVINPASLAIEKKMPLPYKPQAIAVVSDTIVVWPVAMGFDPETGKPRSPDRLAWPEHPAFSWTDPQWLLPIYFEGRQITLARMPSIPKRYTISYLPGGKLHFVCKAYLDNPAEPAKTRSIDTYVTVPELGAGFEPNISGVIKHAKFIYFFIPGKESLYRIDLSRPSAPQTLAIGDPVALTVFPGTNKGRYYEWCIGPNLTAKQIAPARPGKQKPPQEKALLFVGERGGKQVLAIDPDTMAITQKIAVKAEPVDISIASDALYVSCANPNGVLKVDLHTYRIERRFALAATPRFAQVFRSLPTEASWLPTPSLDTIPPRLIVHLDPVAFRPDTLAPTDAPDTTFLPPRRYAADMTLDGKKKTFWADNMHVIRVNDERWVDTSVVTDRLGATELSDADKEGTIAFSVDKGPRHDWTLNRAITRTMWHVQRGTEEFDILNAPVVRLEAGEHELKVHSGSPWARLDALEVQEVLDSRFALTLRPEPHSAHGAVPLGSYRGVFANDEPVTFGARISSHTKQTAALELSWRVVDLADQTAAEGRKKLTVEAGAAVDALIDLDLKEAGAFTLRAALTDTHGASVVRYAHFTRLAKLEHPSLFYRKTDVVKIRQRVKAYPALFERYRKWLRRNVDKPGFLPRRMGGGTAQNYVDMEGRWRALACAFSTLFLEKAKTDYFVKRIAPLMTTGHQEAYEHAWPFAGAVAVMYDLLAEQFPEIARYKETLLSHSCHHAEMVADNLMAADEPLSPQERAFLEQQLSVFANITHYFKAHAGVRGGNWWQGTRANCGCSLQGVFRNLLYFVGFLDYDVHEFFELPFFSQAFIHAQYATPHHDKKRTLKRALALRSPGHHGTGGFITAFLASHLTGNPVERGLYDIGEWIRKMNGPLPGNEDEQVDRLMAETNRFVTPIFLALGWYDPKAPTLAFDDLPPSMLFDVEGEACLKSDWGPHMTDVYFTSGVRDVTYRCEPNHLRIVKGGQILLGTLALQGDHGDPVPSWGNVVLAGTATPARWRYAADWPRMQEHVVIDRYAPQVPATRLRDASLTGITPMNFPWRVNDGIIFHCHTEHKFFQAGRILAYETRPQFDYVAGDASRAWPVDRMEEAFRQVVYLRPDIVVVYDRGKVGAGVDTTRWLGAIGGTKKVAGNRLKAMRGNASLDMMVLSPKDGRITPSGAGMAPVTIDSAVGPDRGYEYLVVFQASMGKGAPIDATPCGDVQRMGVKIRYDGKTAKLLFNRHGAVGGSLSLGELPDEPLAREIRHSYRHWKDHYLFKKWMQDPLLRQYVIEEDLKEFGSQDLPDIKAPPKKTYPVDLSGIHKGMLKCNGATALTRPGPKCPKLNLGASDLLIQARFKLNKETAFETSSHAYMLLMKGMYGSRLLQLGVRAGEYNGLLARERRKDNKGYLDVLPGKNIAARFLDGQFHTLAFARKGNTGMVYVDGVKVGEHTAFDGIVDNDAPVFVAKGCTEGFFDGEIDDVRLWRFEAGLPAGVEQAIALYERSRKEIPAVLAKATGAAYSIWAFDDPDGSTTARDTGNNGYDLQMLSY